MESGRVGVSNKVKFAEECRTGELEVKGGGAQEVEKERERAGEWSTGGAEGERAGERERERELESGEQEEEKGRESWRVKAGARGLREERAWMVEGYCQGGRLPLLPDLWPSLPSVKCLALG